MKKWICFSITLFIGCFLIPNKAMALPYEIKWQENNLCISIDDTDFEGIYSVDYLNDNSDIYESVYDKTIASDAYLLLINGGFLHNPDILLRENGIIYISIEDLKLLDIEATIDEAKGTISLYYNDNLLVLEKKYNIVTINKKSYVPMRAVVEQFGGEVKYIHDYKKNICNKEQEYNFRINLISIEMPDNQSDFESYTPQSGLEEIKKMSLVEYKQIIDLLEERNQTFTKDNPDYDPLSVCYSGETLGRYYVYRLEGFEEFPIFFNKYTGAVYGENPWTQMMTIAYGFPDLSKLY